MGHEDGTLKLSEAGKRKALTIYHLKDIMRLNSLDIMFFVKDYNVRCKISI